MPSKILPTPRPRVGRLRICLPATLSRQALHRLGKACIMLLLEVSLS
jgi:hypothetical protein